MTTKTNQVDNFNALTKDSQSFWETYARGRPVVPPSFWQRLTTYHTQHGNAQFTHIQDLGSGPGIHAPSLAKHFSHVTLTDPSAASIEAARTHLSQLSDGDSNKFTYQVGRAEDPISPSDVSKYDMVFLANALHWMDIPPSLSNIARSLRDHGTLVAALFGVPDVADPTALEAIQAWLRHGVDMVAERDTSGTGTFGHAMYAQDTDYDTVYIDPAVWENVTRIKLNRPKGVEGRGYITENIREKYGEDTSAVSKGENVIWEDDGDWHATTDMDGLRELIKSFPIPTTPDGDKRLWDCLNEVYASKPVEIRWGVSIVLATKRSIT